MKTSLCITYVYLYLRFTHFLFSAPQFIYTGNVTTFRKSIPSRKEISDLLKIGEQFKAVKLIEFCFDKMIAIKEGKIGKVETSLAKLSLRDNQVI